MLIIISDLHLTDGTAGESVVPGALAMLSGRLHEMAVHASWRASGSYRPIERMDIVLLGDVLDLMTSQRWLAERDVRPWSEPGDPRLVDLVTKITSDVLRHNHQSLESLRALAADGGMTLPPADTSGAPAWEADPQPVAVRIHYMVGDHDWPLHIEGTSYNLLRQSVARHLGLSTRHDVPFPHDPLESEELLEVQRRHRVLARHGDLGDPLALCGDRDRASLTDALVIELVGRFVSAAGAQLGERLPPAAMIALGDMHDVRPLPLVAVWLDGILQRTCPLPADRRAVEEFWDRLVERLLELPPVREARQGAAEGMVDGLARALLFGKRPASGWSKATRGWLRRLYGREVDSCYALALAEEDFRNRRAKHVVYGHTHRAEMVPLDASYVGTYVLNQVYFNAGCWRRVQRPTAVAPDGNEFIACDTVNCLAFYQGDEREGRPYESWSATLGAPPSRTGIHRVDPPSVGHAPHQSFAPPTTSTRGPHFAPVRETSTRVKS